MNQSKVGYFYQKPSNKSHLPLTLTRTAIKNYLLRGYMTPRQLIGKREASRHAAAVAGGLDLSLKRRSSESTEYWAGAGRWC